MARYIHAITGAALDGKAVRTRLETRPTLALGNNVSVTEEEIIQKHYLTRRCIPLAEIVWAYRQVAQSSLKVGRASGMISEQRVVVHTAPTQSFMFVFDHEEDAKKLLKFIQKRVPECAIGKTPENMARFGAAE